MAKCKKNGWCHQSWFTTEKRGSIHSISKFLEMKLVQLYTYLAQLQLFPQIHHWRYCFSFAIHIHSHRTPKKPKIAIVYWYWYYITIQLMPAFMSEKRNILFTFIFNTKNYFLCVSLVLFIPLVNFSLIWRHHYNRRRAANFDLYSALMAMEQWGFFSMPHLLWHGISGVVVGLVPLTPDEEG